jgi:serine/threonine protein kinase
VSTDASGNGFDATLREFASGQKLFNRYTLKKTLGRGGMGIVWLARDEELERDVALKFLPELIIHDRAVLGDLKRETRRSLELTHKNIVRIYDFIHDETSGCISMEYIDGDTLSNLRADKPRKVFEPDELTDWTSQLCDALDYAHNHARIVHRDLKPANLMVNQRGDLKVADFGIARSLSDSVSKLTMERGKSGTLVYMSPQQLDGERGNHLDDVYSLGASIYELLTSKPPFYSGNVDRQIREKIPPPMTQRRKELEIEGDPIDAEWEEVVRACLAKNPDRRPQSVAEIAKQLEVPSPKTRRAARATSEQSNKRIPLLTAMGVALLLVAVGTWYFGFFDRLRKGRNPMASQPPLIAAKATPAIIATPEPAPAIVMGSLLLNTSPSGATVTLGDVTAGKTPMQLRWQPGKYPMRIALDGYDTIKQQVEVKENQSTDLGTISLQLSKPVTEPATVPAGPKVIANAVYEGTIHLKNDSSTNVPLTITIGSNLKSGTMTQSGRRGDVVVKFTGVWDGATLHAVTDEVISAPKGISWEPESFTLHFADDSKSATYECFADGKAYTADLSAQSAPAVKAAPIYKGTIRAQGEKGSGTPLTINLAADRRSGTMTQTSKSGDTVVRFNGIWDGDMLRAVTNEVISKPKNVQWKPESFTLRFADDGKRGSYECNSEGHIYSADLSPP